MNARTQAELSAAELALCQTPVIKRSHHAQSLLNLDIINHVAKHAPCGFNELYDLFGDVQTDNTTKERFRSRLNYLAESRQLQAKGTARNRRWSLPCELAPALPEAFEPVVLPAWLGGTVPPAQYDRMHAPLYVPEAGPALRAGALDFKRFASAGDRC